MTEPTRLLSVLILCLSGVASVTAQNMFGDAPSIAPGEHVLMTGRLPAPMACADDVFCTPLMVEIILNEPHPCLRIVNVWIHHLDGTSADFRIEEEGERGEAGYQWRLFVTDTSDQGPFLLHETTIDRCKETS